MAKLDIFLDLDGVLADLRRGMYDAWKPDFAYEDEEKLALWYRDRIRWTTGPVLTHEFWAGLPLFPWTLSLFERVKKFGKVRICSNPGRPEFCAAAMAGKLKWCEQHLGLPPRRVVLVHEKYLLANNQRVLVDDSEENLDLWQKAGGIGLWFHTSINAVAESVVLALHHRHSNPSMYHDGRKL